MSYLNICSLTTKDKSQIGIISPKAYSKWNQIDPLILFFEGIHQFAVKLVRQSAGESRFIKYLPVQLRDIEIKIKPCHRNYHISGKVEKKGSLYKVDFCISTPKKNETCAAGSVLVAEIGKGVSREIIN